MSYRPLGESEHQHENAARVRRTWSEASVFGVPEVGALMRRSIERKTTRLPDGGERTVLKLGQIEYVRGPYYERPADDPEGDPGAA